MSRKIKQEFPHPRSAYSPRDPSLGRIDAFDASMTKQGFADETDFKKILHRFSVTGELPKNRKEPQYGEAPNIDFTTAMFAQANGLQNFNSLPLEIREKFDQNPQEFAEFCQNPENAPELAQMGLLTETATEHQLDLINAVTDITDPLEDTSEAPQPQTTEAGD